MPLHVVRKKVGFFWEGWGERKSEVRIETDRLFFLSF